MNRRQNLQWSVYDHHSAPYPGISSHWVTESPEYMDARVVKQGLETKLERGTYF
jgi:hypothetical protein